MNPFTALSLTFAIACATTPTPAPRASEPPTAPAPAGKPPAPEPAQAFGRYAVVAPAGYTVEARDIEIGFRRDDALIIALDGAELAMPAPDTCQAQLAAFATGVATGLARAHVTVNVVSFKARANGCSLTGTTSGTPTAFVEAAIVDHGIPGPAIAFLIQARPDTGASTAFDQVVASIAPRRR